MSQLNAFIVSLLIEVPILLLGLKQQKLQQQSIWLILSIATLATLLTHPWVWLGNRLLSSHLLFSIRATILESCAIGVEAIVYRTLLSLPWRSALVLSTLANLSSFGFGLVMMKIVSWLQP